MPDYEIGAGTNDQAQRQQGMQEQSHVLLKLAHDQNARLGDICIRLGIQRPPTNQVNSTKEAPQDPSLRQTLLSIRRLLDTNSEMLSHIQSNL